MVDFATSSYYLVGMTAAILMMTRRQTIFEAISDLFVRAVRDGRPFNVVYLGRREVERVENAIKNTPFVVDAKVERGRKEIMGVAVVETEAETEMAVGYVNGGIDLK